LFRISARADQSRKISLVNLRHQVAVNLSAQIAQR
jgi:hypothetical protein